LKVCVDLNFYPKVRLSRRSVGRGVGPKKNRASVSFSPLLFFFFPPFFLRRIGALLGIDIFFLGGRSRLNS